MSRRSPTLDPLARRELAAIDAALEGQRVDPDLHDLEALVRDLRAERPGPSGSFAQELDRRVADGFGASGSQADAGAGGRARSGSRMRRWASGVAGRRSLMPALGAAASVLVALVVAASMLQVDRPDEGGVLQEQPTRPGAAPQPMPPLSAEPEKDAASPTDERTAVPPDQGRGGELPERRHRRVERQASLTLAAPADRIAEIADDVVRVTDTVDGIVVSSNVQSRDDGLGTATFDLRVPTPRLREALGQLSELAHVRSRTQTSQDVTGTFVSAEERLRESLAERQSLLRQLARADTPTEAESVRARLRIVNSEISARRAALANMRERTAFSRVSVTIEAEERGGPDDGKWTPTDALRDAQRVLEVVAGVLLVTAAVVVPLFALIAIATWAVRRSRRRWREQALDAS